MAALAPRALLLFRGSACIAALTLFARGQPITTLIAALVAGVVIVLILLLLLPVAISFALTPTPRGFGPLPFHRLRGCRREWVPHCHPTDTSALTLCACGFPRPVCRQRRSLGLRRVCFGRDKLRNGHIHIAPVVCCKHRHLIAHGRLRSRGDNHGRLRGRDEDHFVA